MYKYSFLLLLSFALLVSSQQNLAHTTNCRFYSNSQCYQCNEGYTLVENQCVIEILINQPKRSEDPQVIQCDPEKQVCSAQQFDPSELYPSQTNNPQSTQPTIPPQIAVVMSANPQENFSEEGIEQDDNVESDLIKTDGKYIYTYYNRVLAIFEGYPEDNAKLLSKIPFPLAISNIFVHQNYLIVFCNQYGVAGSGHRVNITIVDIINKNNPKKVMTYEMTGKYLDSRMNPEGYVYFITNQTNTKEPAYILDYQRKISIKSYFFNYKPSNRRGLSVINVGVFNLKYPYSSKIAAMSFYISSIDQGSVYMSESAIYLAYIFQKNRTMIHKVVTQGSNMEAIVSTKLRGVLKDRFSMDEHDGVLRVVASHASYRDYVAVYCLNKQMKQIGKVETIVDYKMEAVTFSDNRVFISVARANNSILHVVDVSNPNSPVYNGRSLQVEGSRFLYVYSDDLLVSFGRKDIDRANREAHYIRLFNIENVTYPKKVSESTSRHFAIETIDQNSYKDLFISRTKNWVVLPVSRREGSQSPFNGVEIFYIDRSIIKSHGELNNLPEKIDISSFELYNIERSFIIEDRLYTKSRCQINIYRPYDSKYLRTLELPDCI